MPRHTRGGGYALTKEEQKTHERARAALTEGQKLLPGWRAAARMLARNNSMDVKLHAGTTSCTDGKMISIRVPAALAEMPEHDRSWCGVRDEDNVLLCPACDVLEDVNITIIHEISHVIFDTFEEVTAYEQSRLIENAVRISAQGQHDSTRAAKLKRNIDSLPPHLRNDYLNLSNAVSPFLPLLINAGEDIRVNALMQAQRPGTRVMFDAQTQKIFRKGIEDYDGSIVKWSEVPPNAQAVIAIYCKVGGFNYRDAVDPNVAEALDDEELDRVCDQIREAKSIRTIYRLSLPLLENLRRLGFMRDENDEEDDQPDDPGEGMENEESEDAQQGDGDSGESEAPDKSDDLGNEEASDSEGVDADEESEPSDSEGEGDGQSEGDSDDTGSSGGDPEQDARDDASSSGGSGDDEDESDSDSEGSDDSSDSDDGSSSEETGSGGVQPEHGDDEDEGSSGDASSEADDHGDDSSSDDSVPAEGDQEDATGDVPSESAVDDGDPAEEGTDTGTDEGTTPSQDGDGDEDPDPVGDDTEDPAESPQNAGKDTRDSGFDGSNREMGDPEDIERLFSQFGRHEATSASPSEAIEEQAFEEAVEMALEQMQFFDSPSLNITGVNEHSHEDGTGAWSAKESWGAYYGNKELMPVSEGVMSTALQRLRIMFTDNARGRTERNRRTGKVDARMLAKRAPIGDDRLFKKRTIPGRRDYFVLIGLDVSGSTSANIDGGTRIDLIKSAAGAKAELLSRLGIPFAMFAHSGGAARLDIFQIKNDKEPWGPKQKAALADLRPYSANLDGHTLEYYRKVVQKHPATDRLLLYYTDGAMPAANYHEELEILQREIKLCEQMGIHLVGVGVQSTSPIEHGLDTILLNDLDDIPVVITELRKRLM